MQPVALVIPPGVVEVGHTHQASPVRQSALDNEPPRPTPQESEPAQPLGPPRISRLAAIAGTVKQLGDEALIHANGYVCRESFSLGDRPQNFYMIGSMGLAPAIGLGLALARPRDTVVDRRRRRQFAHEPRRPRPGGRTPAGQLRPLRLRQRGVRLHRQSTLALAPGSPRSAGRQRPATDRSRASRRLTRSGPRCGSALGRPGPHFVLVKVTTEEAAVPRIPYTPAAIRDRFRASVAAPETVREWVFLNPGPANTTPDRAPGSGDARSLPPRARVFRHDAQRPESTGPSGWGRSTHSARSCCAARGPPRSKP